MRSVRTFYTSSRRPSGPHARPPSPAVRALPLRSRRGPAVATAAPADMPNPGRNNASTGGLQLDATGRRAIYKSGIPGLAGFAALAGFSTARALISSRTPKAIKKSTMTTPGTSTGYPNTGRRTSSPASTRSTTPPKSIDRVLCMEVPNAGVPPVRRALETPRTPKVRTITPNMAATSPPAQSASDQLMLPPRCNAPVEITMIVRCSRCLPPFGCRFLIIRTKAPPAGRASGPTTRREPPAARATRPWTPAALGCPADLPRAIAHRRQPARSRGVKRWSCLTPRPRLGRAKLARRDAATAISTPRRVNVKSVLATCPIPQPTAGNNGAGRIMRTTRMRRSRRVMTIGS